MLMIPEILDKIGTYAGSYFLLAVNRKPTRRQLLRDGGIFKLLELALETGGDAQMLLSVKKLYPDPEIPILKAVLTKDPILVQQVCRIWNSRCSPRGYMESFYSGFTWGIKNLQACGFMEEPEEEHVNEYEGYYTGDEQEGDEQEDDINVYMCGSLEERLDTITSGQVVDVNHIVCYSVKQYGYPILELRRFLEHNGIEHLGKVRQVINFRGPSEHVLWLVNICVDLGYEGKLTNFGSSRIESGVIYYKYPSTYDVDIACWMYYR